MGDKIFFPLSGELKGLASTDEYSQFFNHYFLEGDVLLHTFLIGLGIALVIAAVFYFVIGNVSYSLSNRIAWFVTLAVTGGAVYFASAGYVKGTDGGSSVNSSGLFLDCYNYEADVASQLENNDDITSWAILADDYRQDMSTDKYPIVREIAFTNTVYALVFFILLSFAFKWTTRHARNIPV